MTMGYKDTMAGVGSGSRLVHFPNGRESSMGVCICQNFSTHIL